MLQWTVLCCQVAVSAALYMHLGDAPYSSGVKSYNRRFAVKTAIDLCTYVDTLMQHTLLAGTRLRVAVTYGACPNSHQLLLSVDAGFMPVYSCCISAKPFLQHVCERTASSTAQRDMC